MATAAEIREGLEDYVARCNANPRLRKMLRKWSRTCAFTALEVKTDLSGVPRFPFARRP